ncbi:MAG: NYN domain-containing protein [Candidatus Azambacteria bacterium]|nr:NYN domain-containing protein [Candidatus Azambacteria bacterium]
MVHKSQRVGIFIDIKNLYHSSKNLYSARVNYRELIKELLAGRDLIRIMGYVVKSETAFGEDSFFESLEKNGIENSVKDLKNFTGIIKKARQGS